MSNLKLFVYLKNTDLTCLSAKHTITNILGYQKLISLRRFMLWEIAAELENPQLLLEILNKSYYILNPNKEAYYLEKMPKPSLTKNQGLYLIKVISQEPNNLDLISKKIQQKFNLKLTELNKALVWEMVVQQNWQPKAEIEAELTQKIILTSSIQNGILINPIYEKAEFLDPQNFYF